MKKRYKKIFHPLFEKLMFNYFERRNWGTWQSLRHHKNPHKNLRRWLDTPRKS